jgi:hypothetical protein
MKLLKIMAATCALVLSAVNNHAASPLHPTPASASQPSIRLNSTQNASFTTDFRQLDVTVLRIGHWLLSA